MPAAKPPEFRRRALDLVAMGEPVAQVAKGLGISEGTLRRWMSQDDLDSGHVEGLTIAKTRRAGGFVLPGSESVASDWRAMWSQARSIFAPTS